MPPSLSMPFSPFIGVVERAVPAARVAVQRRVHLVNFERRAVVAHEEEQRAFLQAVFAQGLHHAAHAVIDGRDHGQGLPAAFRHRTGKRAVYFGGASSGVCGARKAR